MDKDFSEMDADKILSLTPEVTRGQAILTIGTIGEVAHGKSTLIKALSGVQTARFSSERYRNMSIKLGYANAKIYKCDNEDCPCPGCYRSYPSSQGNTVLCDRPGCLGTLQLLRHVSIIDCPGTDILLATVLNGLAAMDAALLLVAGNLPCPQPQASEHLAAIELMKINKVLVLQSKIDLVEDSNIKEHHEQIQEFIKGILAGGTPVLPISAIKKQNLDSVCEHIANIPVPIRDYTADPRLYVIRSFDVNKPGHRDVELKGGVAGGSLLKGILRVGQEIEIRPGTVSKDAEGNHICTPMKTRVVSLFSEQIELRYAVPGGLIGVGTTLDSALFRADKMVGQVLGAVGSLPDIYAQLTISFLLLRRLLGVRTQIGQRAPKIQKLSKHEVLMVTIGSLSTGGCIMALKGDLAKISLAQPACAEIGQTIAISRRVDRHWRLIGKGQIKDGVKAKVVEQDR